MKICTVEGCVKTVKAKGLCDMHLQRMRRTGSVGGAERTRGSLSNMSGIAFSKEFVYKRCNVAGCEENGIGMGFCEQHLEEYKVGSGFRWRSRFQRRSNLSLSWLKMELAFIFFVLI